VSLTVLDPGLYSLVVDLGRPGCRARGVPLGGAADRAALALGNALVGNSPDTAALEITLSGPTLRAERRVAGVAFGAPFTLTVPGRGPVPAGTTFTLEAGEVLRIGGTPEGVRGYLCVPGGFEMTVVLESRSGLEPVAVGTVLPCRESALAARRLPFATSAGAVGQEGPIRVLDGPQRDWFLDDAFFTNEYTVTPTSNRMGIRLTGPPLKRRPGEMVSEPVAPGAVQVTNDGLPVILGVDGQTIGGYPKVAHVIRADLDRVGQLRPGTAVRFRRVNPGEAEAGASERSAALNEWLRRLRLTVGEAPEK
jgi:biotin-dependent carboxylase-like uncharacterized protein